MPTPNLFDLIAPDYREWQRMAEKFRPGTVSLSNLVDLYSEPHVAMLLAGLAIENLAKGLVIRREGLDHGGLPKGLDKHETLTYLDRGKFKLSAAERRLVRRLEEYVVWAGPIPCPSIAGSVFGDVPG